MKRLRIGITIGLSAPDESLWVNGIKQNAIYLAATLASSPWRHAVVLANTTDVALDRLPWPVDRFPTARLADVEGELDVLIELGGQISGDQTERLKSRGARLISYCCGSEYVAGLQSILFDRPLWRAGWFVNQAFDALWFIPQVASHTLPFLQTLRRAPARVVPFVWEPMFIEASVADLPNQGCFALDGHPLPPRVAVMEPNIDVVKSCLVPVFGVEQAYRRKPAAIGQLIVCNALDLAHKSPEFQILMNQLDIVRDGKALFTGRHQTGPFLATSAEVVVSHQWDNPLNYFYFDVCWLGYPLVHNATLCQELGYFYPGFDAEAAGMQLLKAMDEVQTSPSAAVAYRQAQRQALMRFTSANPANAAAYDELFSEWF